MWTFKDFDYKKQINPKDPWKDDAWVATQFVKILSMHVHVEHFCFIFIWSKNANSHQHAIKDGWYVDMKHFSI